MEFFVNKDNIISITGILKIPRESIKEGRRWVLIQLKNI
jgi:hypothetical protein